MFPKTKIILADDHRLFRNGIKMLLERNDKITVVGEAGDGVELLELLEQVQADILLLDLNMPEMGGMEVLEKLKGNRHLKVIALTMHAEGEYVAKAVRLGVAGYLLKDTQEEELNTAIERVMSGEKYFNRKITELLISNMSTDFEDPKSLSPRELEVLEMVSNGLTTKEIAQHLFVSDRTIETHRVNIMKKLNASNTAELIKIAAKKDLI